MDVAHHDLGAPHHLLRRPYMAVKSADVFNICAMACHSVDILGQDLSQSTIVVSRYDRDAAVVFHELLKERRYLPVLAVAHGRYPVLHISEDEKVFAKR